MSDRFLFRAWDNINDQWLKIPIFFLDIHNGWLTGFGNNEKAIGNRYTLEQCTGLKDKNGKLIYEGDIVDNGCACSFVIFKDCAFRFSYNEQVIGGWVSDELEVIGNIHENKELLK